MSRTANAAPANLSPATINALNSALIAAQADLKPPVRNRSVSVRAGRENYDYSYATLDMIIEHCLRPILPRHGLWFIQYMSADESARWMVTEIIHTSGESKSCPLFMPSPTENPQEAGSLISYFKRYSLCAAFGLAAEEDDDGVLAAQHEGVSPKASSSVNPEHISELEALAAERGADLARFCRYMKIASLDALPMSQFERAKAVLRMRRAA